MRRQKDWDPWDRAGDRRPAGPRPGGAPLLEMEAAVDEAALKTLGQTRWFLFVQRRNGTLLLVLSGLAALLLALIVPILSGVSTSSFPMIVWIVPAALLFLLVWLPKRRARKERTANRAARRYLFYPSEWSVLRDGKLPALVFSLSRTTAVVRDDSISLLPEGAPGYILRTKSLTARKKETLRTLLRKGCGRRFYSFLDEETRQPTEYHE